MIIKAVSYLSPNLFWYYQAITEAIFRNCGLKIELMEATTDPLDDQLLQHDHWDLMFICGLPLIRHNRIAVKPLQLLAAPVMLGDRYENQPIYFADIVVNAASNFKRFEDLAGTRFCYNDRGSNSGYNLLRYRLLSHSHHQETAYFSDVQQSGSHQRSLQWIVSGLADCAAIDSVVMEAELRQFPELAKSLRVIESMRSPMPPIAVSSRLAPSLIEQMQNTLFNPDPDLQAAMTMAQVKRYAKVTAQDYEPIAVTFDAAMQLGYEAIA
ncbi:phosphate/phosphite/phosphonate ABC transporter substrate-binding protein [Pseudanabaena sp. UWO310]|uniref:phosphate/phosphite/phosphonate ABC transporter substrate-binding protein n=1 Tax=Pseudanabaena sp. UWO310 TaxID=2480795 RepID=UPI00115A7F7A|nr:PhnD/SsuA/transferrin family substrate-binding protein [Pseudanabaena sp. UWO310]TYQ29236.1 PhnD/SsuA/transferrin family substrate-binding protein [Pseudanabaena sp. UWO310]